MMRRVTPRLHTATPRRYPLHPCDNFLTPENASYLDTLPPDTAPPPPHPTPSLDPPTWASLLHKADDLPREQPLLRSTFRPLSSSSSSSHPHKSSSPSSLHNVSVNYSMSEAARLAWMCRAWQVHGHLTATLDPLNLHQGMLRMPDSFGVRVEELEPAYFGFTEADLERSFYLGMSSTKGGLLGEDTTMTLRELHAKLKSIYGQKIGYQFMHLAEPECAKWFRDRIETPEHYPEYLGFSTEEKLDVLHHLARGELFEQFLHTKFVGSKRFGLDGGESLIPGMMEMIQRAASHGVEHIVLGMPHRGRLSVLTNVCGKSMEALFKEFKGLTLDDMQGEGSGDVKYHLGMTNRRVLKNGSAIQLSLLANPSHLEAVNPLVEGKARAKQHCLGDTSRDRVMAVQLHGDAAFAGQGVCYETMGLGELESFSTGGTIHIVVNNQIGFTTDPKKSRSSPYCTDLGRVFGCPVLHVNGDSPEDVARVFRLAADFRKEFKKSIIVDLVCYRRFGHNETDEPMFTQPLMYRAIKNHPTILTQYTQKLISENCITPEETQTLHHTITQALRASLTHLDAYTLTKSEWYDSYWKNFRKASHVFAKLYPTQVSGEVLRELSTLVIQVPPRIALHPKLASLFKARQHTLDTGKGIGWATAEALAFGSLLQEGIHLRLSGQDVAKGSYHQRHAVVRDALTGVEYSPLKNMSSGRFVLCDSPGGNYGVLGYELGYSMESPQALVIWEAPEGELVNSAQIVVDQFIASGEAKWGRQCGLVVALPVGCEGEGPDLEGARVERFLQAVDEEVAEDAEGYGPNSHARVNMEVVSPTTPANYFHLLRRQIHRNFRKPLVLFLPKTTVGSAKEELVDSEFAPVIADEARCSPDAVTKVVLCCGPFYYRLCEALSDLSKKDVVLVRVEQLAPFPDRLVKKQLERFPKAKVVWAQEEPRNMGAWSYVRPRINAALRCGKRKHSELQYRGPRACSVVCTGDKHIFAQQQKQLVKSVFDE